MSGKRIFISYSRRDIDYVKSLVEALRSQGFEVWFDKNIMTGNDWDDTIEEEIKKADALVLILSKTSVSSDPVKDEMSYALSLGKSLNPIKIEECDVPMRLARKQFIDFEALGHELGFERLVKDLTLQLTDKPKEKVTVQKGTFKPPVKQQQRPQNYTARRPKSNNNSLIIGGIIIGGGAVVILIVFLIVVSLQSDYSEDYDTYDNTDSFVDYNVPQQTGTIEDQDWNTTLNSNNLDGYIAFLYTYGRTSKYYDQAYEIINQMLPKSATVWYGVQGGNYNFTKYLFYDGDNSTPPQYDDIITPIYKSELYEGENFVRNGNYVQPGQRLLVYDTWVDANYNIWARIRYN
ncbi:toll/interleukin-1 receptor domain-containing protein [Aequorivita flava]|uniref:Toll/interleukin-1 receptor domain-containing protein n=1 Tax=Aequorivita flava TaxID=3114371 RepID=A0AB35YN97_9FLAO